MRSVNLLLGRLLLAAIFIMAGINKIIGFEDTQAYMAQYQLSGSLLPLVIAVELGGGLLVAVGWFTRYASWLLAVFTISTAAIFHSQLSDTTQMIMFMKNLAMAGGFLILAENGPGTLSIEGRRR